MKSGPRKATLSIGQKVMDRIVYCQNKWRISNEGYSLSMFEASMWRHLQAIYMIEKYKGVT